jgi:hypothetical protein
VVPVRLSKEKLELAGRFIERKARPLDKTLFQYHFGAVSADAVLAELAHYQNSDGGFGHGLEADFRLAASSPMATSVGLQYAVSVNTSPEHPMIVEAMRYLVSTYKRRFALRSMMIGPTQTQSWQDTYTDTPV